MKKYIYLILLLPITFLMGCQKINPLTTSTPITTNTTTMTDFENETIPENKKQTPTGIKQEVPLNNTLLYKGSWFDIKYPKNFTPSPTEPLQNEGDNQKILAIRTNEAYFTAPDKAVEFFVFSPIWGGNPINYLQITSDEELVSEKTSMSGPDSNKKIIKWVTLKAKDNTYYRSYVSIKQRDTSNTSIDDEPGLHYVFGIKYQNQETYQKYKKAFEDFKSSLVQYAD